MKLPRSIAATTAALATAAVASLACIGPAEAATTTDNTETQAALLAALEADSVGELRTVVSSEAIPDSFAATLESATADLSASTPLATDESAIDGAISASEIVRDALARAIDPTAYQCEETEFSALANEWVMGPLAGFDLTTATPEEIEAWGEQLGALLGLLLLGGLDAPAYDLLLNPDDPRFSRFGTDGINETADLRRSFFEQKRFWDIDARDFTFRPMKATVIFSGTDADIVRWGKAGITSIAPATVETTDTPEATELYRSFGQTYTDLRGQLPWLDTASNPVWTLNAFAFQPEDAYPALNGAGRFMAYGDGLLAAQAELGLLDAGSQAVLAHEYGHQVQYTNGAFGTATGPEATRRTELMADAYASYFVTHDEGADLNRRGVAQAVRMFEEVGDCGFDSDGHHGTPLQRQAAAFWGVDLAENAPCVAPRGKASQTKRDGTCRHGVEVIATKALQRTFDAALPSLIAPDA